MLNLFKQYLSQIIPYDPAQTWLRQSFKGWLAIMIAIGISLFQQTRLDIAMIIAVLLMMISTDVQLPLKTRIFRLSLMWLVSLVSFLLLLSVHPYRLLATVLFVAIVGAMTYLSKRYAHFARSVSLVSVMAVYCYVWPLSFTDWRLAIEIYLIAFAITLAVSIFVFPDRLPNQLQRHLRAGINATGRYVCYLLADAALGNHSSARRMTLRHTLLQLQQSIHAIAMSYQTAYPKAIKEKAQHLAFEHLCSAAISLDASLRNMPQRVYLYGPSALLLKIMRHYKIQFKQLVTSQVCVQPSAELLHKFSTAINEQLALIRQTAPQVLNDFKSWYLVLHQLRALDESIATIITSCQGGENDA